LYIEIFQNEYTDHFYFFTEFSLSDAKAPKTHGNEGKTARRARLRLPREDIFRYEGTGVAGVAVPAGTTNPP
jgi:hypothetical protein